MKNEFKIGDSVTIRSLSGIAQILKGRLGRIIAIGQVGNRKEYIVQFKKPFEWSYFKKKELRKAIVKK